MSSNKPISYSPHIVVIAPYLDGSDVSEVGTAFQLLQAMDATRKVKFTILTVHRMGRPPISTQMPGVGVVSWPEPTWLRRFGRFNDMIQPINILFYRLVRRWIKSQLAQGRQIDLVHQMLPRAPRYSSPLPDLGIPYIIGPVGGSLPMPTKFLGSGGEHWFVKLRGFDQIRFRFDPWLRRGFAKASLVLGVAPYMAGVLKDLPIGLFESFLALGADALPPPRVGTREAGHLKLLFVGRAVRSKGLREAVKAIALLNDLKQVTLTVIGDGPELAIVRTIANSAGVADRVHFLGRLERAEVEKQYSLHDVLLFPSFRESMGAVIVEAMRWGLPVISVDHGGPGDIIDNKCGRLVPLTSPEQMPHDLALQCRSLALDVHLWQSLSNGARQKVEHEALWPDKATEMLKIYDRVLKRSGTTQPEIR